MWVFADGRTDARLGLLIHSGRHKDESACSPVGKVWKDVGSDGMTTDPHLTAGQARST